MNFYISDLHFGHKNIIKYDQRPFNSTKEMDEEIIKRWNETVKTDDTVYILGDVSWYISDITREMLKWMNGHKILIKGNHDKETSHLFKHFDGIYDYLEIVDGIDKVVLSHYPMLSWNGQFRNSVHLYGHVHITEQDVLCEEIRKKTIDAGFSCRTCNVGCMKSYMNYTPRTLKELRCVFDA